MALFFFLFLFFFFFSLPPLSLSTTANFSLSFPLFTAHSRPTTTNNHLIHDSLITRRTVGLSKAAAAGGSSSYNYKLPFKYSMAPVVSLPIGTPPQTQQMVLDTGSQLSWIQCHKKALPRTPPPSAMFDPSLSSTFSVLPCNHPICKPRVPDFTLPTTCDQNRLCHYSYFYADGTLAEGNLVREKFTFSRATSTPPLTLGCAQDTSDTKGILGMNLGRLSFSSQAKITKFSYCIPARPAQPGPVLPTGTFYLGNNPNSATFQSVDLLTFSQSQRMPNLDPLAHTVVMLGVRIGAKKLSILPSVFRPDASGAGQTMIDSGSELTYFVDEAYTKVKEEVVRLVGPKLKKGYVYAGVADMCFDVNIGQLIGDLAFEFDKGAEIVIPKEQILHNVDGKVWCVAIGRSSMIGAASNIIGNVHQQNQWVEFDLANRKVGFGKADCSRSV